MATEYSVNLPLTGGSFVEIKSNEIRRMEVIELHRTAKLPLFYVAWHCFSAAVDFNRFFFFAVHLDCWERIIRKSVQSEMERQACGRERYRSRQWKRNKCVLERGNSVDFKNENTQWNCCAYESLSYQLQQFSRVSHENIVSFYGACTEMPICSLVMESLMHIAQN